MRTWEEAAQDASEWVLNEAYDPPIENLARLDEMLDFADEFSEEDFARIIWFALDQIPSDWNFMAMDTVVETIVSKQHDYGHGNINRHGLVGIGVRMCDKVARIKNLQSRDSEALNESLRDSWTDLIGYALIGIMFIRGTFQLPLERDLVKEEPSRFVPWRGQNVALKDLYVKVID